MATSDRIVVNRVAAPITSLGPGKRVGLWVQGCTLSCIGCASVDTWDPTDGFERSVKDVVDELASILGTGLDGLTISGGEPFQQGVALARVVADLRRMGSLDGKDVMVFTGYGIARATRISSDLVGLVDAIVAGPYVSARPGREPLLASDNQQLHLITPLARERYSRLEGSRNLQVAMDGDDVVMAGLPDAGDLERFQGLMAARGITFGGVSW